MYLWIFIKQKRTTSNCKIKYYILKYIIGKWFQHPALTLIPILIHLWFICSENSFLPIKIWMGPTFASLWINKFIGFAIMSNAVKNRQLLAEYLFVSSVTCNTHFQQINFHLIINNNTHTLHNTNVFSDKLSPQDFWLNVDCIWILENCVRTYPSTSRLPIAWRCLPWFPDP